MASPTYKLPKLPYAYDMTGLEPSISKQIMELHHGKHHQTYIANLNKALGISAAASSQGRLQDSAAQLSAIRFNGGGHINHSLCSSQDPGRHQLDLGKLRQIQGSLWCCPPGYSGSGWGWLVKEAVTGQLRIVTLANQEAVVVGDTPIFGVDMWENAYYLQYLNGKAAYVENIWKVISWKTSEARYVGGRDDAFKVLKANM
ncbi:superoxide dismutase [Xylariales sp. AK1849]|nr:superoxide dismutase [Xylariales sp. AK1849]